MTTTDYENVPYDLPQPTAEEREEIFARAIQAESIGVGRDNGEVVLVLDVGDGCVKWTGTPLDAADVAMQLLNEAASVEGYT